MSTNHHETQSDKTPDSGSPSGETEHRGAPPAPSNRPAFRVGWAVVLGFYGLLLAVVIFGAVFSGAGGFVGMAFPIVCMLPYFFLPPEPRAVTPDGLEQPDPYSWRVTLKSIADGLVVSALILTPYLFLVLVAPGWFPAFGLLKKVTPLAPDTWRNGWDVIRAVASMLVAVAIFEELFFRGFLHQKLAGLLHDRYRFLGADVGGGWIAAAALFALPHLFSWGRGGVNPLGLMTFFPGLVFGWLYARRRNIAGPVICHTAFNMAPPIVVWLIAAQS